MAQYIYDLRKGLGLEAYKDEANNVVVKKPASPGCEDKPPLMLQGHTDMVCVKLPDCGHDFEKDPLKLEIRDGPADRRGHHAGGGRRHGPAPT